jgi:hypothetical protein
VNLHSAEEEAIAIDLDLIEVRGSYRNCALGTRSHSVSSGMRVHSTIVILLPLAVASSRARSRNSGGSRSSHQCLMSHFWLVVVRPLGFELR